MKYFIISFRSIFFYSIIMLVYKIMGKREIGELSIIDFIVSLFIAELVAIAIENYQESLLLSVIPISIIVFLQIFTSRISFRNKKVRDLLDGKYSVIMKRGKIHFAEMKKNRYNLDDLLCQLRENGIKSLFDVDYAILEPNGKLSVFKKEDNDDYPLPVILDGVIEEDVLFELHKNREDFLDELKYKNIDLENVYYGFYKDDQLFVIEKDKIN